MRILAPLLVLSVLGLVAIRWLADPRWDRDRVWIEGAWDLAAHQSDVKERLTARLEDRLAHRGEDPETRWFAARAWLKIGEVGRALDAVWGDPALAAAPGTAHRFGALLLRVLGFVDDQRFLHPRTGAAMASLVLAEGGDEEAAAWLDTTIRDRMQGAWMDVLYGTFLYATHEGRLRVAQALRARGEPPSDVVASLIAVGPEAYPGRDDDLARLEEIVLRDADRIQQRIIWSTACVALGRSEDAHALDVLAGLHRRLSLSPDEGDQDDAGVVAAGLLAAGRWSMRAALAPYLGERGLRTDLGEPRRRSIVRVWYADAVLNRLARGDPEAVDAWLEVWEALQRYPDPRLTERVANGLLLGDAAPPAHLPVSQVLAVLEGEGATAGMHAIAAAWRVRAGEPAGRAAVLALLRRLAERGWSGTDLLVPNAMWISPVLAASRALVLYDPTPGP